MPNIEGTITAVHSREMNRKSDNKPFTVYEVVMDFDDRRKYQTFSRSLANEANRYLNQAVEVGYHAETRGSFENLYLDDVRPPPSKDYSPPPQGFSEPSQPPREQYREQMQKPVYESHVPQPQSSAAPQDRDWSIWRQTAAKVSAHISHSPAEFWSNIDDLVEFFHSAKKPERFLNFIPPVVNGRDMSQVQREPQDRFLPAGTIDNMPINDSYQEDDTIPF